MSLSDHNGSSAPATAGPARTPIPILRWSTDALPPEDRYEAWRLRDWPRSRLIYHTEPTEAFGTRWETSQLGPVGFVYTEITAMRWERRLSDIRASDFDPIVVSMMVEGAAQGEIGGRAFRETAGMFHLHDLAQPSLHVSTASVTYNWVIPRPVAETALGSLADLAGLVVPPEPASLLFSYSAEVRRVLPRLDLAQAERLGGVFLELLTVCLSECRPSAGDRLTPEQALRRRAEEIIEQRMGDGEVTAAELCQVLKVSRGRLFAAFRADGGIGAFVMGERLKRARAALADQDRAEPIGAIAHRLGFSDASHLSRVFRQRYGLSPRDYRRLVQMEPPELGEPQPAER